MMNDGMLSQDEIDALLRGTSTDNNDSSLFAEPSVEHSLTEIEEDTLGEVGNISFGSSATALSTLLNQKVEITTPKVTVVEKNKVESEFPEPYVAISVNYTEGFTGSNVLVIEQKDAAIIADLMLGGDGHTQSTILDEIQLSAVQEAMNQMMGSAATSMSTIFQKKIDISPPAVVLLDLKEGEGKDYIASEEKIVKVAFNIKIGDLIDSQIMQVLPMDFALTLVSELHGESNNNEVNIEEVYETTSSTNNENIYGLDFNAESEQSSHYASSIETTQQKNYSSGSTSTKVIGQPTVNVQPAVFSSFEEVPAMEPEQRNLNMLLDIPLQVTVELGRTRKTVKDILDLSSGSIIELDKLAGEPVDILVNNKLIAQGEVVVIDESFGVRVTDIISQTDRLKRLK
ncbi:MULTISPECIES: flagellar motor switch phosphatase FliY [Bacillus]|uniref:flagellar motor switch phosphatase FliY n=1 Tax=Bacillus TaxID=1386 RepID=UPI000BB70F2A|nr:MULTISPECIES: flagellar motor switch phosphatase FliY [Bacillus]